MRKKSKLTTVFSVVAVLILTVCLVASPAVANDDAANASFRSAGDLGLGLGNATLSNGLSAKYYLTGSTAVQFAVGYNWWGYGFGLDFVQEMGGLWQEEVGKLLWYAGLGGGAATYSRWGNNYRIGAAGILGLGFQFAPFPLELALELRPTLYFGANPNNSTIHLGLLDAGGAIRYYF